MEYNSNKVEQFKKRALDEYKGSQIIEKISKLSFVEKTDGSFVQVGLRFNLEDDFLIYPNFDSTLPGVGRAVANGEEDLLIQNLLENKDIEKIDFQEDIIEFPKYIESQEAIILMSNKFTTLIPIKLMHRIDYERGMRLDYRHEIITITERVLSNKIIILDKRAILWQKQIFDDKESLDIHITPAKEFGKVEILLRSVNKIQRIDPSLIKIIEVNNEVLV